VHFAFLVDWPCSTAEEIRRETQDPRNSSLARYPQSPPWFSLILFSPSYIAHVNPYILRPIAARRRGHRRPHAGNRSSAAAAIPVPRRDPAPLRSGPRLSSNTSSLLEARLSARVFPSRKTTRTSVRPSDMPRCPVRVAGESLRWAQAPCNRIVLLRSCSHTNILQKYVALNPIDVFLST
jgi:hypothetical protein